MSAVSFRILTARELLEIREEARRGTFDDETTRALYANAALLARAIIAEDGEPRTAEQIIDTMSLAGINALVEAYAAQDASGGEERNDGAERNASFDEARFRALKGECG